MYTGGTQARSGTTILVVRLGAMGDIVHTLPAVASLKHSFPGSRLTWVVEPQWAPLLEGNPFVDRVALLNRDSPGAIFESCRELRTERYDMAVDFQGLIKSALVASVARPERIYGFHQSQVREKLAALVYSNKTMSRSVHVVDKALDLAADAGAGTTVKKFPLPSGRQESPLPGGPFVLACPLAGWRSKQWPPEYYGELAVRLRNELGVTLVVDGPASAAGALAAAGDAFRHFSCLPGLLYAIRRAAAVVGGDSGPLHLAAALGKPGVAIFGPTDPARNGPYGGSITVLRSAGAATSYKRRSAIDDSMYQVTPDAVFDALKVHLSARPRSADCLV
ncbi:MAG TPA: glycosyltransferase family 9 protein [Bryobacteraceae bacterium]|nr:glycosyltransferase family 9 protein [Bryobacteraceae bacterium]